MPRRSFEVRDPAAHFARWAFEVTAPHWETLGVVRVDLVDVARTRRLRKELMAEGMAQRQAVKRAIHRSSFTDRAALARHQEGTVRKKTGEPFEMPPQRGYAFAEGYVFVSKHDGGVIQILDVAGDTIDVCQREPNMGRFRQPYRLGVDELVDWLQTGRAPAHRQISLYELRSELMRTEIRRDNGGT